MSFARPMLSPCPVPDAVIVLGAAIALALALLGAGWGGDRHPLVLTPPLPVIRA